MLLAKADFKKTSYLNKLVDLLDLKLLKLQES